MYVRRQEVVEPATQPRHAVGELVREGPLAGVEPLRHLTEGTIESSATLGRFPSL